VNSTYPIFESLRNEPNQSWSLRKLRLEKKLEEFEMVVGLDFKGWKSVRGTKESEAQRRHK